VPAPQGRIHAVLINGGDRPQANYQSHLLHVREVVDLLRSRDVRRDDIVVFSSDGSDPAPDLAVLDEKPEKHFWLIEGLPVGSRLRPEMRLVDSRVRGEQMYPASRRAIQDWFSSEAPRLVPGDVLLIYVTDHGHKNGANLANNAIVLWGEELSVDDMRSLLAKVPQGVRTVMLMSQCFSGSFANVVYGGRSESRIDGSVCGFFSAPADRYAYGCYAENRGKENIGHSFQFLEALRVTGTFDGAHDAVLVADDTPDVPLSTSGEYLDYLLGAHAGGYSLGYQTFADKLLEQAWADDVHYRKSFARIDAIGRQFGAFGPRTVAELDQRTKNLTELRSALKRNAERWDAALDDLKREHLARFLAADPGWGETLAHEDIERLDDADRQALRHELLRDLARFTRVDAETAARLKMLRTMARAAGGGADRMEVRIAAALRMRDLLGRIAGEVYLDRYATHAERAAYEALRECEAFALPGGGQVMARVSMPPPFPPLDAEAKLLATVLPGWLGMEFRALDPQRRATLALAPGAVTVTRVYRDSPAARAGIAQGDIVLGPPGAHFAERNQVREWVMTSMIDETRTLDVLRDGRMLAVPVRISAPPADAP
jgi:hypothetical protein